MKQRSRLFGVTLFFILSLFIGCAVIAQVQTPRYISTSSNSNGFYEYLPQGYSSGSEQYPLLVFIHGMGELGNGGSNLPSMLNNGPPRLANNGTFPTSFTVHGSVFKFIIISPQFVVWPESEDVDAVINYAVSHYRVNRDRIYLTGLSMGGGVVWDYVGNDINLGKKIAAIVPICGASWPDVWRARTIAQMNLPVWATHNQTDPTVPASYTIDYVNNINAANPPPSTLAKRTIFPVSGHDAWSHTYDPAFKEDGMNVYEWMLQFQLNAAALPVVMGDYKAYLSGTSSVVINWTTLSESNNSHFIIEKSFDGQNFSELGTVTATNEPNGHNYSLTDNKPLPGNEFYRLAQVDKDGKITYFKILKVIVPAGSKTLFKLSPNPVVNNVQLDLVNPATGPIQVNLTDMQGHMLKTWKFQKANLSWQQSIDVSGIPPGSYIIQLSGNNVNEVQKFIKR